MAGSSPPHLVVFSAIRKTPAISRWPPPTKPVDEFVLKFQKPMGEHLQVSVKVRSPSFSIEVTILSPALSQTCLSFR